MQLRSTLDKQESCPQTLFLFLPLPVMFISFMTIHDSLFKAFIGNIYHHLPSLSFDSNTNLRGRTLVLDMSNARNDNIASFPIPFGILNSQTIF